MGQTTHVGSPGKVSREISDKDLSKIILDERGGISVSQTQVTTTRSRKFLVFSLAGERYAIPLSRVKEVTGLPKLTPLPGMPNYFLGLMNLRGAIISVIDLFTRLAMGSVNGAKEGKSQVVIIIELSGKLVGIRVQDIIEVVSVSDEMIDTQIESLQSTGRKGLYGVAQIPNRELTMLLDLERTIDIEAISQSRAAA